MSAPAVPATPVLQAGQPWPMGASVVDGGINVAVFSAHATQVDLCLFDATGHAETARLPLPGRTQDVWHGWLPHAGPGQVYGLRAHGPWAPESGHRFNPHKLLLDPWARDIVGPDSHPDSGRRGGFDWSGPHFGGDRNQQEQMDPRDNAATALKARVVADHFNWQGDQPPRTPLADSVLYELHVRSFTRLLPGVPEAQRGTYAGLASDAAIAHLQRLGVTAVSLLPVQQIVDEQRLVQHGLVNHWGYNTVGFFCPDPRYAATPQPRDEFKRMVQRLHAAGLEVLLDVVYNHTAESDNLGPTISWRGLDNASWYRLPDGQRDQYVNWTGCGNTLNLHHPRALQMVLDSLRYWVSEMHVDGFRFDLAPVLGRGGHNGGAFDPQGAFFQALQQDPVLQRVKLIAEPWDLGPDGYQLGNFPRGWLEWNDKFRDTTRAFWLRGDCTRGELASRLAGSSRTYQPRQRSPLESVNYVVSHDGFTLADLVCYDRRHNEPNLEDNRDGHAHNLSWNCGVEGPTSDPAVLARRARLQRALLATTLLSQGTPMLAAGDELGHTQQGNNNPYCQDNTITWIDWPRADQDLIDFTAHVLALRRRLQPLGANWYTGAADAQGQADLSWFDPAGDALTPEQWGDHTARVLAAHIGAPGRGTAALLLLMNGNDADTAMRLPPGRWHTELDSTVPNGRSEWQQDGAVCLLPARGVLLLRDVSASTHPPAPTDPSRTA